MKSNTLSSLLLAACALACFASRAADPDELVAIVVTGSRVITNGDSSPSPVTVVSAEQLQTTTPSSISDALLKLPVFVGSSSVAGQPNPGADSTGSFLNLRGMGANRTLVLLDGQRLNPTTIDGLVDTNMIPQMLLKRVDVVTGGASAVYGSDAVTGVVNFIMDKDFTGIKGLVQGGISSREDLGSGRIGVAAGTKLFDDRGHVVFSLEHFQQTGLNSLLDRPNGAQVYTESGTGTAADPFRLITNSRVAWSSVGGVAAPFSNPFVALVDFGPGGAPQAFNPGQATTSASIRGGGDGAYIDPGLRSSLNTDQAFARFDMDFDHNLHFHVEGMGSFSKTSGVYLPGGFAFLVVQSNNPFLTPAAQAALVANGMPFAFLFGKHDPTIPPSTVDSTTDDYRFNLGLSQDIGENLKWSLDYSHGDSANTVVNNHNVNLAREYAATDSVLDANGKIVCQVTLTNPGLYPGCVPLDLFGPGSQSAAAEAYIADNTRFRLVNKLDDFNAVLNGSLFNTWAGPVATALNAEYRRLTLTNRSSAQPGLIDCTGLDPFNCTPTKTTYQTNVVGDVDASQRVAEGALEVNVPLLKDVFLAQALDLNGAYRYTHYDTSGGAKTWKVGLDWRLTEELTVRGTRSQDIRAPSLNDLYSPLVIAPGTLFDLHTGTTNITNTNSQGNPNLVPEVAQTWTLGTVYRPLWLPRFSVAIDYYRISINNAIASISGNSASVQTTCEQSNGTSPLCNLLVRPLPFSDHSAANIPLYVLSEGLNVANTYTEGADFEANYNFPLFGGELALRSLISYQPKLVTTEFAGAPPLNAAGSAGGAIGSSNVARLRAVAFVSYRHGPFDVDIQTRWRSSLRQNADTRLIFLDQGDVPAVSYTDLSLAYTVESSSRLTIQTFLAIQNVLDQSAPNFSNVGAFPGLGSIAYSGDDVTGRYFTAGVRVKL